MPIRKIIAAVSYTITGFVSLTMGSIYLFSSSFMPYHSDALSMSWADVPGNLQVLLLALMTVAGDGFISLGIVILTLTYIAFKRSYLSARYLVPVIILVFYIPTLLATLSVLNHTPATPPWYGNAMACLSAVIGFLADAPFSAETKDED